MRETTVLIFAMCLMSVTKQKWDDPLAFMDIWIYGNYGYPYSILAGGCGKSRLLLDFMVSLITKE